MAEPDQITPEQITPEQITADQITPERAGAERAGPEEGAAGDDGAGRPLAELAALRPTAQRRATHEIQVRRLLDAGLELLVARGTSEAVRVADIVAATGLSNKAFYRYFASKDDLVAAIVDDGARRAESYLRHQMGKQATAVGRLTALIEGYLGQATDPTVSAATRAVLSQSMRSRDVAGAASRSALCMLTGLAEGPLRDLGVAHPDRSARLLALTLSGATQDLLWHNNLAAPHEVAYVVEYCLAGARVGRPVQPPPPSEETP